MGAAFHYSMWREKQLSHLSRPNYSGDVSGLSNIAALKQSVNAEKE